MTNKIINEVNKYYTEKVITHGATPQGVDWNGIESQENRFEQLLKITNKEKMPFTLLDFGCGFGSLLNYLEKTNLQLDYIGYDISEEMLKHATAQYPNKGRWLNAIPNDLKVDYVVASGLFNVKLNQTLVEWEEYIITTLNLMNQIAVKGFSFNILTSYSDAEYMKEYLYYASPEFYFKHCKLNYSKQVSLLHDYQLYEFTILVKK